MIALSRTRFGGRLTPRTPPEAPPPCAGADPPLWGVRPPMCRVRPPPVGGHKCGGCVPGRSGARRLGRNLSICSPRFYPAKWGGSCSVMTAARMPAGPHFFPRVGWWPLAPCLSASGLRPSAVRRHTSDVCISCGVAAALPLPLKHGCKAWAPAGVARGCSARTLLCCLRRGRALPPSSRRSARARVCGVPDGGAAPRAGRQREQRGAAPRAAGAGRCEGRAARRRRSPAGASCSARGRPGGTDGARPSCMCGAPSLERRGWVGGGSRSEQLVGAQVAGGSKASAPRGQAARAGRR